MGDDQPIFEPHEFRKATRSVPDKDCVQVARRGGWVELRDDKTSFGAPNDHRLAFTAEQFDDFLAGVRSGSPAGYCLEISQRSDGSYLFRCSAGSSGALEFTETEVVAFLDGIVRHEFDAPAYGM